MNPLRPLTAFLTGLAGVLGLLAAVAGGMRGGDAARPRRLFGAPAGPEGRERTLFETVDWQKGCQEPADEHPRPAAAPVTPVRHRGRRRLIVAVALPVVALVAGMGAFAYWTSTGNGAGTASSGTTQPVTIGAGVTSTVPLFPGRTGDVTVSISNPNPIPVFIPSLTLDTSQGTNGFAADAGHAACVLSILTYTAQSNSGLGWTVPKKVSATNGVLNLDLTGAISMSTGAVAACQSATFIVYLKVGP